MAETVLEEIKLAEKEAERLVGEAGGRRAKIIADARNKAAQFLKEKEDELSRKKAQAAERLKEKLLAARQKLLEEGSDKLKSLRKSAEKRAGDAVELVLDAFEKKISEP